MHNNNILSTFKERRGGKKQLTNELRSPQPVIIFVLKLCIRSARFYECTISVFSLYFFFPLNCLSHTVGVAIHQNKKIPVRGDIAFSLVSPEVIHMMGTE